MKYLVTGAAGFIGSHVAEKLLKEKHDIAIIDEVNSYYDVNQKIKNIEGLNGTRFYHQDICDKPTVDDIISEEKPDVVIHLAARAGVRPSIENPALYNKVNVFGTGNLLDASLRNNVKKFIFASSSSVYGERDSVPFSEKDPVDNQKSPYAATKRMGEILCKSYSDLGLPTICLRFFTVYGERGRPDMAPFIFSNNIMNQVPIKMFGDGSSLRDYTYIEDIVDGVYRAASLDKKYDIINLGNSSPISLKDFIAAISKITGKDPIIKQQPTQNGDVSKTYADISKAKDLLGWEPKTSIEEGLEKTIAWLKNKEFNPQPL